MNPKMKDDLDTSEIKEWRSIITLVVFVLTNAIVLFPFHIPLYVPRKLVHLAVDALSALRIIPSRDAPSETKRPPFFVRYNLPQDLVIVPLVADLFLLAISAIGRREIRHGTLGSNNIFPIDIAVFSVCLAYFTTSIDGSGLLRYVALKTIQKFGVHGHRLFFYLYSFAFGASTFAGNDPVLDFGTAFLMYIMRVSSNIHHPRAWIHTQFVISNIASTVFVSSNGTNVVLAGAFNINFIHYTANVIVPVAVTAIIMYPFTVYVLFPYESLIPRRLQIHELPAESRSKSPVNPNIPNVRGRSNGEEEDVEANLLALEEIMYPFLDKSGAAFGVVVVTAAFVTILALNAASSNGSPYPVFWVTLPAAFLMFSRDMFFNWRARIYLRHLARRGREETERFRAELAARDTDTATQQSVVPQLYASPNLDHNSSTEPKAPDAKQAELPTIPASATLATAYSIADHTVTGQLDGWHRFSGSCNSKHSIQCTLEYAIGTALPAPSGYDSESEWNPEPAFEHDLNTNLHCIITLNQSSAAISGSTHADIELEDLTGPVITNGKGPTSQNDTSMQEPLTEQEVAASKDPQVTLLSIVTGLYSWIQETFPTPVTVLPRLPYRLAPFPITMFILIQALVSKGWVTVLAYGWDHWVSRTGTVGAIGGMGFLSVILCNVAGTNIGSAVLLCRMVQTWVAIRHFHSVPISERTFWATVYSMAIGVNYGAFSAAFSASLTGIQWRDILSHRRVVVRRLEFARTNLPIIALAMAVSLTVLVGQVYITRGETAYMRR